MSLLTIIWFVSLSTLVGITLFAFRPGRFATTPRHMPRDFSEFIRDALTHIAGGVSDIADTAEPHARRMGAYVIAVSRWGHNKFIDRVFGKTAKAPGRTASFFLKYIAENKEEVKGSPEQKAGLQK